MLSITMTPTGFDEFLRHLDSLTGGGLFDRGFKKFAERARDIAIKGTPVGDSRDEHPGLMKRSWESPVYKKEGSYLTATITNTADYGVAENYGHFQNVGQYVPAIGARLVHSWVPGTYALETSMDTAELQWESVIEPEVLRRWNEPVESEDRYVNTFRQTFYDRPMEETGSDVDIGTDFGIDDSDLLLDYE